MKRFCLILLTACMAASAQRVSVYSPFTRIDPMGEVVKADRGSGDPRTILSPGVPRNGVTPVRIVVELDKPEYYWLEIGQNPENSVKATLYKENLVETPEGWVPDTLTEVPGGAYRGFPSDFRVPGQTAVTFWLEMEVAADAPVDRVKVEPQLYLDSIKDWIIYPMEVRIQQPVLPKNRRRVTPVEMPLSAPTDTAAFSALRQALCPGKPPAEAPANTAGQLTNRELLQRYVHQDLYLAADQTKLQAAFLKAYGADSQAFCAGPKTPAAGPEWYLRLRDAIYRNAGAQQ